MTKIQVLIVLSLMVFLSMSQRNPITPEADIVIEPKEQLHFPEKKDIDKRQIEAQKQIGKAIDILAPWNLKICSTCAGLKFFAIKAGNNAGTILRYLTVGANPCAGPLNYIPPTGPSGRPGNNQLFVATQLQDETWLLQPRNCVGSYIKATSAASIAVGAGYSSTARFWIEYHDNHVHMQSAAFPTSYWNSITPLQLGGGATSYIVQYWPNRAWP